MELYIQIKDGQPFAHPIFGENFKEAFPEIDTSNLPPEFARFVRVEAPIAGLYKVVELAGYEFIDGAWTDAWTTRDMTQTEREAFDEDTKHLRLAKIKAAKDLWDSLPNRNNFIAWSYDETSNAYQPPIPRPEPAGGKAVRWCGADTSWREAPDRPTDGGNYMFNYTTWTWDIT